MIEASRGNMKLIVNPEGGYIEEFSVDGTQVLFSGEIDGKKRATHVCLPNFGPDKSGKLEQHGFGRRVSWTPLRQIIGKSQVQLEYIHDKGDYQGLLSSLKFKLKRGGLKLDLACRNRGDKPMRLAPGFHPYFVLPNGESVLDVDDKSYKIAKLDPSIVLDQKLQPIVVRIGDRTIGLTNQDLPYFVLWSGNPSEFVCVEPTAKENSFEISGIAPADELLKPGESRKYTVEISILQI